MGTTTILKLGWTNPLTDTFGAHPTLGGPLDLNDGQTFALVSPEGLELAPPPRTLVPVGNIRSQGERISRAVYRHSREAVCHLLVGPMASYAALASEIRTLVQWLNAPPAVPITIQYQPPNASAPVYLDVVGVGHDLPMDEGSLLRLALEPIEIVFICRPGLRGDRVTLSNLVANPGFAQGSGPAVLAFSDALADGSAYVVEAGGALTQDTLTFADRVDALGAVRYYRHDEASGTTLIDAGGNHSNATLSGSGVAYGVASLLTGDADKALTFDGTAGKVSGSVAGLPSGNAAWAIFCRVSLVANPASSAPIVGFGNFGTAKSAAHIGVNNGGGVYAGSYSGDTAGSASIGLNTPTSVLATYDGTTMRCYVNGVLSASATPGPLTISGAASPIYFECQAGASVFVHATVDEVCVFASDQSGNAAALHAAATVAPSSAAGTLSIPAAGQVAFGSADWWDVNLWQMRFRYAAGLTATWYLHYADASNYLAAVVSGTALALVQVIAGVSHTLGTVAVTPVNGIQYWLRISQFPTVASDPADVSATLFADAAGAVGSQIATTGTVATFDAVTALSGQPRVGASGAALAFGGAFPSVHTVSLFGPGGWTSVSSAGASPSPAPASTCPAAMAWDSGTVYSGGPVVAQRSARMDAPPVGIWHAQWETGYAQAGSGAAPAGLWSPPVSGATAYAAGAWCFAPSVSSTCVQRLLAVEYDASGSVLATAIVATHTGALAAWTHLSGTWTTQASAANVQLVLDVYDSVAAASAGHSVWWANVQMQAGVALGPYCELRFPQSPAQLLVSGLLGDLPAPALLQMGTYLGTNGTSGILPGDYLTYMVGRRGQVSGTSGALFVTSAVGYYGTLLAPVGTAVLDATAYEGRYVKATVDNGGWNPRGFSPRTSEALGSYHVIARFRSQDATPTGVHLRAKMEQLLAPWYADTNTLGMLGTYYGPYAYPLASANVWTVADAGQVQIPMAPVGSLSDPTQTYVQPRGEWVGTTGGGAEGDADWLALMPVDGSLVMGTLNDPANNAVATGLVSTWLWLYGDGLLVNRAGIGDGPSWAYSLESVATPAPGHAGGGPGIQQTGPVNLNTSGDPYLTLDPSLWVAGQGAAGQGVNQLVAYLADQAGSVLPCYAEVMYSPLYLWPR